jgi:hypothetical protein
MRYHRFRSIAPQASLGHLADLLRGDDGAPLGIGLKGRLDGLADAAGWHVQRLRISPTRAEDSKHGDDNGERGLGIR